ncbi:MAG: TGS domain-containing protein, partial [Candidatus Woesearchaeota archaeon]
MSNVKIVFPDGKNEEFSKGISVLEIAEKIGPRLAMAAIAAKVNGALVDVSHKIESDSQLQILTGKDKEGLEVIRHSAAHLFAHALLRLFPESRLTIGPVVDEGFYYDIDSDRTFSPADFPAIEAEMEKIVKEDLPVYREELSRQDALKLFSDNPF